MRAGTTEILSKAATVALLVLLLVAIRAFEDRLFYDPFLDYFKNDYLTGKLPAYDGMELFFALAFRYFLNSMLSLAIIYVLFQDKPLLRFTVLLYLFLFVVLALAFFALLHFQSKNSFLLFYTRRFLIQPLFLILFVPAFYYQRRIGKK